MVHHHRHRRSHGFAFEPRAVPVHGRIVLCAVEVGGFLSLRNMDRMDVMMSMSNEMNE